MWFGKRGVLCFCPWSVAKKVTVIFIMCLWREFCKLEWETVLRWTVFQTLKKISGRNQCLSISGKFSKWQNTRFYVSCFFLNLKNSSWFRKTILYTLKYCKLWYFLNQFYKILSKDTGKTAPLGNILKLTADHVRWRLYTFLDLRPRLSRPPPHWCVIKRT